MNWKQSLVKGKVKPHQTSKQELDNIRKLIARDLADASVLALSADRRFATAYNAALQSGTITIACSGSRVNARAGHHSSGRATKINGRKVVMEQAHLQSNLSLRSCCSFSSAARFCERKKDSA